MSKTKAKKQKYYAIKDGIEVKDLIVTTWEECSKLVLGYNAVYKSFPTKEQAEKYLGKVDAPKVKEQAKKGMEHKRVRKETTRSINVRLSKELYNAFEEKCEEFDYTIDKAIINMIEEWVV